MLGSDKEARTQTLNKKTTKTNGVLHLVRHFYDNSAENGFQVKVHVRVKLNPVCDAIGFFPQWN